MSRKVMSKAVARYREMERYYHRYLLLADTNLPRSIRDEVLSQLGQNIHDLVKALDRNSDVERSQASGRPARLNVSKVQE